MNIKTLSRKRELLSTGLFEESYLKYFLDFKLIQSIGVIISDVNQKIIWAGLHSTGQKYYSLDEVLSLLSLEDRIKVLCHLDILR